tara:strand:- start:442 stop:573 length:132 start_codon:yes stop_codon:yes gene_type:complete
VFLQNLFISDIIKLFIIEVIEEKSMRLTGGNIIMGVILTNPVN